MKLIIGLGNEFRSDDSVGLHVARELKACASQELKVETHQGDATSLMDLWEGADELILVDALQSGRTIGDRLEINLNKEPLPPIEIQVSTHGMGVREAIELSKTLGDFPESAYFYGIECGNFEQGVVVSSQVQQSLGFVVKAIKNKLRLDYA